MSCSEARGGGYEWIGLMGGGGGGTQGKEGGEERKKRSIHGSH